MKRIIFALLFLLNANLLLAQANPVINEVLYDPTGGNAGNQLIEIKNIGNATADIGGWWFCSRNIYTQLPAGVTIPSGGIIVFHVGSSGTNTSTDIFLASMVSLNASAADINIFFDGNFTSPSSIRDFVQWGSGGNGRESVAASAGIWTAGDFITNVAEGHSIEYDGDGNSSSDWFDQPVPTIGQENGIITSLGEKKALPQDFTLSQNYPNPFNPTTIIRYEIPSSGEVFLWIYNIRGEEIDRPVSEEQLAGIHQITWDASNVSTGIYFYRLQAGDFVQTKKMVLLK